MKIILSGGGTGGHIYPAVAVAEALRRRLGDDPEILFVGARGKMEMEKIPALGYRIVGLPTEGLYRKLDVRNLLLPFRVARSLRLARRVVRDFGPDVVVGFGGYASAPVLRAAQAMGVPTVIQEQNSYAGLANKLLARRARSICVAYEGMERFFPASKIVRTGNPMRASFSAKEDANRRNPEVQVASCGGSEGEPIASDKARAEALEYFGFTADKPVLLVVGGSLGSRTLNDMMMAWVGELLTRGEVQIIWQTGKFYAAEIDRFMSNELQDTSERNAASGPLSRQIWRNAFIERMDLAYAAADLVISRSGAGTVSELSLLGKPALFVPSPNVAEDHQTRNAMALVDLGAAEICPDGEAARRAIPMALDLLSDPDRLEKLSRNIAALGIPDSAERIVDIILNTKQYKQ